MTENSPLGRLLADALQGSTPYGAGLMARPIASQGLSGLLGMQSFGQRMASMPQPAPAATGREMLQADFGRGIQPDDPRIDLAMALSTATPRAGIRAYHGSPHDFDRFSVPANSREPAVFLSSNMEEAQQFGPRLYETIIPRENVTRFRWSDFDANPIYDPQVMRRIIDEAIRQRVSIAEIRGVQNFEHGPRSTSYAVFDPSLIEIIRKYGLAGVLASGAGYGVASPVAEPQNP